MLLLNFASNNKGISVLDIVVLLLVVGHILDGHRVAASAAHQLEQVLSKDRQVVVLVFHLLSLSRL